MQSPSTPHSFAHAKDILLIAYVLPIKSDLAVGGWTRVSGGVEELRWHAQGAPTPTTSNRCGRYWCTFPDNAADCDWRNTQGVWSVGLGEHARGSLSMDEDRREPLTSQSMSLPPTAGLAAVVALAARVTGCSIAMINVVDGTHQYTLAAYGMDAGATVPIAMSACAGVIARGSPVVIPDVADDVLHGDIAGPVRDAGFRAYAGIPMTKYGQLPAATLCVLDTDPQGSGGFDVAALQQCAVVAGETLDAAAAQRRRLPPDDELAISLDDVAAALDDGQIVPWYMPIVDLNTGHVVAMEALARWIHPDRGILGPDAFVPLVEHSDLIIDFDLAMFAQALADLQSWRASSGDAEDLAVSVNFSAHHFYRPDCVDRISAVTRAAGVTPASVTIEITETVAVSTTALIAAHVIDSLRSLGYTVVLDDIGGNWLPAEHLLSIDVNGLKADRTVGSALHTSAGRAIARALVALTTELGQFLVIEGIETAEQAEQARLLGAQMGQGYLWSRAHPAHMFSQMTESLRTQAKSNDVN